MIDQCRDVRSQERYVGIKKLDRSERTVLVKLFDKGNDLISIPYLLFDIGVLGQKQLR